MKPKKFHSFGHILKEEEELMPTQNTSNGTAEVQDFFYALIPPGYLGYLYFIKYNFLIISLLNWLQVEEIFNFTQEDLDIDDPFILDCYAEVYYTHWYHTYRLMFIQVYVWVGTGSNEQEKKFAMQTALVKMICIIVNIYALFRSMLNGQPRSTKEIQILQFIM